MKQPKKPNITDKPVKPGRPPISDDKRREMREKIAASTQFLFQKEGYRQISMRRIAAEVGCSPMTLYKYYDAKIDILHTLWSDVFEIIFNRLDSLELANKSPREQLVFLGSAYVSYWLENPEHYRLVFMTEGVNQPDVSAFIANPKIVARYEVFLLAIANASPYELTHAELRQKLDAMMCFVNGIAHNLITISQHDWPPLDYLIDAAMRGVVNG
ncbi:MAG: AcrR family transcriptional regulator [Arenicella sp.]|jgi:AcrR family transcriptional regulator